MVHTVPSDQTHKLLITCTGYIVNPSSSNGDAMQGVLGLYQYSGSAISANSSGTKITSSYITNVDGGDLVNLPIINTFQYVVSLNPGTYTFRLRYTIWSDNVIVNHVPSNYLGYDGDTEAMKSRMGVLVFTE